ncbi:uncharacterized protein LOC111346273 [Stylophora pistillata]|uniref:uncharacterized protein LOC111346273 n=1 Tax=Stylophora pistillata TaxID=50429 RepID=UPI000C04F39F|nr:uncharacterized protein LOC111346273 [Stylophora pistillata]
MLRTLPETQKSRWAEHLNHVVHAYNCTKHESTGYSPFFLLFGRHPRLPVDLMFETEDETNHVNHSQYVEKWRKAMTEAYKLAGKKSSEAGTRAKQRYDRFVRSSILLPGYRVLVRNLRERGGPGKLRSHWEDQTHKVVSRKGEDSPVYEVKPEAGPGRNRILHRNLLLPCNNLPINIPNEVSQRREGRIEKDKRSTAYQIPVPQAEELEDGTCSNDEYTITPGNPYTGQFIEEAVTEELAKSSVEEKQPKPTQSEDAISDHAHRGKVISDQTVLEETEETGLENGKGQDPLAQDNNSPPDNPELEPRLKRQRHPPTVLTYNTLGNPTYESQAAVHDIAADNFSGTQLPQRDTPNLQWRTGLSTVKQFQLPPYSPLSQYPAIFGYPGTYLQYPPMPPPVFYPVNQFPAASPIMYQPRSDLLQAPVTMNSGHVPAPGFVF